LIQDNKELCVKLMTLNERLLVATQPFLNLFFLHLVKLSACDCMNLACLVLKKGLKSFCEVMDKKIT